MKRIYVIEEVCIACHLCEVHCRWRHSSSKDLIKAFKREAVPTLSRVRIEAKWPLSFSVRCLHCDDSPCVDACLTGALSRDAESGVVNLDEARCIGCWTCILVCPFGAIKQDLKRKQMVKCDLCQGDERPACVVNCPNEALIYAEIGNGAQG